MVRGSASLGAQVGRLATPQAEALGGPYEKKVQDFFREVCMCALPSQTHRLDTGKESWEMPSLVSTVQRTCRCPDFSHGLSRITSLMRSLRWETCDGMCRSYSDTTHT